MTYNPSPTNKSPNRDRYLDQILVKPLTRFTKTMDPPIPRSRQGLNETSILMRTNSDPCPLAGNAGLTLSAGLTMLIITQGIRRGTGPQQIKRSTTVLKAVKRMLLATIITVVSSPMTCWKPQPPPRSLGTPPRLLTLPLAPSRQAQTPLQLELVRYQPDGRNDTPPREGLIMLTTTQGPQPGWTPDARQ